MHILFNECSLHGQFSNTSEFATALDVLMDMRKTAKKFGREIYCCRNYGSSRVTRQLSLSQAVQYIEKNKCRALMIWFGKTGPYWQDTRQHSGDDYIECQGQVVTDTTIGECAYLQFSDKDAQLASIAPSKWTSRQFEVIWYKSDESCHRQMIFNHISSATLKEKLRDATPPIQSWKNMEDICRNRFDNLYFSDNAFKPLKGIPFKQAAAEHIVSRLHVLSRLKSAHTTKGRTQEGNSLYQEYFTGQRAQFTDSSPTEKNNFRHEMTFSHPENKGKSIFAPYHGKIRQTPPMRIHFSWPVKSNKPLYVLYIGNKITKH